MFAEKDSFYVRLPEFAKTSSFRWIISAFAAFVICILLMSGLVYWQTSAYVTAVLDRLITNRADTFSALPLGQRQQALQEHLSEDPFRVKLAALFDTQGNRISGNIESLPQGLKLNAPPQELLLVRLDALGRGEVMRWPTRFGQRPVL